MHNKIDTGKLLVKYYESNELYKDSNEIHKFINTVISKDIREYVRAIYLGREYNILKSRGGAYRKFGEIRKWVEENCREY